MDEEDMYPEMFAVPDLFGDNINHNDNHPMQSNSVPQQEPTDSSEWKRLNCVSTLFRCEAADAKGLYIFDISNKLKLNMEYDIGGAYNDGTAEFWFSCTTTRCPGNKYLMNLFVCHRNPGMFALGISNKNGLISKTDCNQKLMTMSRNMDWFNFNTSQANNMTHYIKTFLITEQECESLLGHTLIIPILIDTKPISIMNKHVVERIKFQHEFGEEMFKGKQPDFILKSDSGKEYKVHKIVLAAHSPVIRDAIRTDDCNSYTININDNDIELLLQFLYTGKIQNILEQKYDLLLAMAYKFKLQNLAVLVKSAIEMSINFANALSLAVLAEKYEDKEIEQLAFQYVKTHPETLDTDDFTQIDNSGLFKKLLKYIHVKTTPK